MEVVVASRTAHAKKGAGTKTTLYVSQEDKEDDDNHEGEEEGEKEVGGGGGSPSNPSCMISVQKVRLKLDKAKGKTDGWFPQPLSHNTRQVCTDDPESKLAIHSLCASREWECERCGVTAP